MSKTNVAAFRELLSSMSAIVGKSPAAKIDGVCVQYLANSLTTSKFEQRIRAISPDLQDSDGIIMDAFEFVLRPTDGTSMADIRKEAERKKALEDYMRGGTELKRLIEKIAETEATLKRRKWWKFVQHKNQGSEKMTALTSLSNEHQDEIKVLKDKWNDELTAIQIHTSFLVSDERDKWTTKVASLTKQVQDSPEEKMSIEAATQIAKMKADFQKRINALNAELVKAKAKQTGVIDGSAVVRALENSEKETEGKVDALSQKITNAQTNMKAADAAAAKEAVGSEKMKKLGGQSMKWAIEKKMSEVELNKLKAKLQLLQHEKEAWLRERASLHRMIRYRERKIVQLGGQIKPADFGRVTEKSKAEKSKASKRKNSDNKVSKPGKAKAQRKHTDPGKEKKSA